MLPKMSRPSEYTQDIAEAICERIADGESLRAICRDETMPDARTVHRWVAKDEEFRQQYARAMELRANVIFEDVIEIADDTADDTTTNADGAEIVNHEHIARSRLRVDARKWFLSKVAPKKYGDRLERLELSGDADNPLHLMVGAEKSLDEKLDRLLRRSTAGAATEPEPG